MSTSRVAARRATRIARVTIVAAVLMAGVGACSSGEYSCSDLGREQSTKLADVLGSRFPELTSVEVVSDCDSGGDVYLSFAPTSGASDVLRFAPECRPLQPDPDFPERLTFSCVFGEVRAVIRVAGASNSDAYVVNPRDAQRPSQT